MAYCATWGGTPQFWQETTFTPAVMWLSGHGWHNPMTADVPGLEDFLYARTDRFDPAAIPDAVRLLPDDTSGMDFDVVNAYHPEPQFPGFLPWQRYHLYLVLTVTACWALFGIAWSSLTPLYGLLFGTTVAAAYGIFRLALRRPLAIFGALLVLTSPLHLEMLPQLRDYAKAPFILLVMLLCGVLIRHPLTPRARIACVTAAGIITGIGLGFRMDLGICVPAVLVVIACFVPGTVTARERLLLAAAFLGAFVLSGFPILREAFRESGHFAHIALLGLLERCDQRLGVGTPLYALGGPYTDFYLTNLVQTHTRRATGAMPPTWVMMPPYHEAAQRYLQEYLWTFPADFVTRAYAANLRVLDELGPNPAAPYAANISNRALLGLWDFRQTLMDWAPGGGRYYAAAALIVIAGWRLRAGFAALFLLLFFAGYTAIQFNTRHAFHLEWISWWCGLLLIQFLLGLPRRPVALPMALRAALPRVAIFLVVTVLGLVLSLALLRAYQARQVADLEQTMRAQTGTPLVLEAGQDGNLLLPNFADAAWGTARLGPLPVWYATLDLAVAPGAEAAAITLRYAADDPAHYDYTRTVYAPASASPQRLLVPFYFSADSRFLGLHIPPDQRSRLQSVSVLADDAPAPFGLTWTLTTGDAPYPRYQVFTR